MWSLTCSRVANALEALGFKKGDAIAIDMPMNVHAVTAYLAIVLAGCVAVPIPDSFVANEVAVRMRISKAKAIFTQVLSTSVLHVLVHVIVLQLGLGQ
jgi:acyl-coenzyme A synthetase/AMP-(fatty) acid ligase